MKRRERPGKASLAASAGVHAVVVVVAWTAQVSSPELSEFVTYQIEIVSPPPVQAAEAPLPVQQEEVVVETPDPLPLPEEPEPAPVVEEKPVREEKKPEPTPTPPPPEPEEEAGGDPEPAEREGGEDLNIRMEGLRRDFPDYHLNIIRQINRCMRFNGPGGLKTTVYFAINKDGGVDGRGIDFVSRSGNAGFDFAVMEAVECAGSGRFGPLPAELGSDRFPVVFEVTSSRRGPLPDYPGHPRDH